MTETEQMRRDLDEMQQQWVRAQHEGFMRDIELMRLAKQQQLDLLDLTKNVNHVTSAVNALLDRMDKTDKRWREISTRMDQTDKRWNELIILLGKEHGNGGGK
jgi:uncharacterized protein YukE